MDLRFFILQLQNSKYRIKSAYPLVLHLGTKGNQLSVNSVSYSPFNEASLSQQLGNDK